MTSTKVSQQVRRFGGLTVFSALALAGCGGGSDNVSQDVTAAATDSVPDTAAASTENLVAYELALAPDDRAEPLEIGNLTLPTDDRAEPTPIGN